MNIRLPKLSPPPPPPPPAKPAKPAGAVAASKATSTPAAGRSRAAAEASQPGRDVHTALQQHPEERDAVYRQLAGTDPALIYHLESWRQQDEHQETGAASPSAPRGPNTQAWDVFPNWTAQAGSFEHRAAKLQTAAPLDAGLRDIDAARHKLAKLKAALPPPGSGGPGEAALAAQQAQLRETIESDLERAGEQVERAHPNDPRTAADHIASRAEQIKALAPGDAAFAALVDGAAISAAQPPAAAPLDAGLKDIEAARDKLAKLKAELPPAGSGGPGEAALAAQKSALLDAVQADLERAGKQAAQTHPSDPRTAQELIASRAEQIKELAPGDASFAALVDGVVTEVIQDRTVDASSTEVQRVYESQGAVAAAQSLDSVTAAHPELAGRIVAESAGTIDAIAADLGRFDRAAQDALRDAINALGAAAERGGPASVAQVAASIASGAADADFGVFATGPRGNPAIASFAGLNSVFSQVIAAGGSTALAVATADALRAAGRTDAAARVDQAVVTGVDALHANFENISDQYTRREIQLQQDLAAFGPALSPDEQAAYVQAYWADESTIEAGDDGTLLSNAEVRRQFSAGDDQLATAIQAATPTLQRLALADDENAGEVLLDAYESLARTPAHAQRAADWALQVESNTALFEKLDGFVDDDLATRLRDGLKADALESMASQLLLDIAAAEPAQRDGLISRFIDKARGLDSSGAYLDDIEKITQIQDDWQEFQRLSALPVGHPERARIATFEARLADNAQGLVDGWGDKNGFGKSLAAVGLVVGFADTLDAYRGGDLPGAVLSAIGTGKDAAEIGIGMLGVIGTGGRAIGLEAASLGRDAASVARLGAQAADFGARFLPLVGFGLDAVQLVDDVNQLRTNPNLGEGIAAIGTLLALGGDVLEVIPVAGTLLGGVLGAIGSLVHGVGGFLDGLFEGSAVEDALHARQRSYLEAAGINADTARHLVDAPTTIALLDNFGMRPEFLRELVDREANDRTESEEVLTRLALDTAAAHGLTGTSAERFIAGVLSSPHGSEVGWSDVGFAGELIGLIELSQIVNSSSESAAFVLGQARRAQVEWFRQHLPDIYNAYFAPIPGVPASMQPGHYQGPGNTGYFEDLLNGF